MMGKGRTRLIYLHLCTDTLLYNVTLPFVFVIGSNKNEFVVVKKTFVFENLAGKITLIVSLKLPESQPLIPVDTIIFL